MSWYIDITNELIISRKVPTLFVNLLHFFSKMNIVLIQIRKIHWHYKWVDTLSFPTVWLLLQTTHLKRHKPNLLSTRAEMKLKHNHRRHYKYRYRHCLWITREKQMGFDEVDVVFNLPLKMIIRPYDEYIINLDFTHKYKLQITLITSNTPHWPPAQTKTNKLYHSFDLQTYEWQ